MFYRVPYLVHCARRLGTREVLDSTLAHHKSAQLLVGLVLVRNHRVHLVDLPSSEMQRWQVQRGGSRQGRGRANQFDGSLPYIFASVPLDTEQNISGQFWTSLAFRAHVLHMYMKIIVFLDIFSPLQCSPSFGGPHSSTFAGGGGVRVTLSVLPTSLVLLNR